MIKCPECGEDIFITWSHGVSTGVIALLAIDDQGNLYWEICDIEQVREDVECELREIDVVEEDIEIECYCGWEPDSCLDTIKALKQIAT